MLGPRSTAEFQIYTEDKYITDYTMSFFLPIYRSECIYPSRGQIFSLFGIRIATCGMPNLRVISTDIEAVGNPGDENVLYLDKYSNDKEILDPFHDMIDFIATMRLDRHTGAFRVSIFFF